VNRDTLLEAALRALSADPDAGLDAVASAAGLSRRTVYGHFRSRDALVEALADRAGEHVAGVVQQVRTATVPGEPALTTLARLEVALWHAVERYRLLGSLATRPEHRARVRRHTGELNDYRVDLLTSARADGDLAGPLPVAVAGRLVQTVPFAVFDAVLDGALAPGAAARVAALTVLAVAGAAPDVAVRHVDAALAPSALPSSHRDLP
jgi:AcrR family transcriptional regulator